MDATPAAVLSGLSPIAAPARRIFLQGSLRSRVQQRRSRDGDRRCSYSKRSRNGDTADPNAPEDLSPRPGWPTLRGGSRPDPVPPDIRENSYVRYSPINVIRGIVNVELRSTVRWPP
jgi:hypothetical protein